MKLQEMSLIRFFGLNQLKMFKSEFKEYLKAHNITASYGYLIEFWIYWCRHSNVDILTPKYDDIANFATDIVQSGKISHTIRGRLNAIR